MGTFIVLVILIVVVFFAVKGAGKTKCSGDCAHCGGSCSTGNAKSRKKISENKNDIRK